MNLWKFLSFFFSFSKEIGRLGVWAWLYLRKGERKILSSCTQKSSFKRFRQKHPLIFVYSYGLPWHYSYEQVYTLWCRWFGVDWVYAVQSALKTKRKRTEIRYNKSLVFNHGLKKGGLFLVLFMCLLLCYVLTWMVSGSWDLFRERECEVVAGAFSPPLVPLFWTIVKNFK